MKRLTDMNRRDLLKVLGLGGAGAALSACDMPSYVTMEEGAEDAVPYLAPEEFNVPGVGVWYASTCTQCPQACGIHGRVREGRVLKLEGNPETANRGRLCQMGQAALQGHFNPDRLRGPLAKRAAITWEDAEARLQARKGGKIAWATGTVSGHQRALIDAHVEASQGSHYAIETVNRAIWAQVCGDVLGDADPRLDITAADVIISFGADFLGTWGNPVENMAAYGDFRRPPRGTLVQIESKMSLSGANADHWIALKPGHEGLLALSVARALIERGVDASALPADARALIEAHDPADIGVSPEKLALIAAKAKPGKTLVLAQTNTYADTVAVMILNLLLGSWQRTLHPAQASLLPPVHGSAAALADLAEDARSGRIDTLFVHGANPLFTAPESLKLQDALQDVFVVALATFPDETAMAADLVIPLRSALEDWGSHAGGGRLTLQQPLMEPLYPGLPGINDFVLQLLKDAGVDGYGDFADSYAYLRSAVSAVIGSDLESDWNAALQKGVVDAPAQVQPHHGQAVYAPPELPPQGLTLIAAPSQRLYDGRHANLPWLLEQPDHLSKIVWDSWIEVHPATAAKLGVTEGDRLRVTTEHGTLTAPVYVYKGIHPDCLGVPIGFGHTAMGRYAKGRGINPLSILSDARDPITGELKLSVPVTAQAAGSRKAIAKMGGAETQHGRKLVATVPAHAVKGEG